MGEGGQMFRDGEKMIASTGEEVSCYKGNWVNIVQVEEENNESSAEISVGFHEAVLF